MSTTALSDITRSGTGAFSDGSLPEVYQVGATSYAEGTASLAFSLPSGIAAGDLIVIYTVCAVRTANLIAGYTRLGNENPIAFYNASIQYKVASAGEAAPTVSFDTDGSDRCGHLTVWRNVDTTVPVESYNYQQSGGDAPSPITNTGSIATTSGRWMICVGTNVNRAIDGAISPQNLERTAQVLRTGSINQSASLFSKTTLTGSTGSFSAAFTGANYQYWTQSFILKLSPTAVGSYAPSIKLTVTPSSAAVNLSAQNFSDWAKFGNPDNSFTPSQVKLGGGSTISAALVGGGTSTYYPDDPRTISWTDGSPTASGSEITGTWNAPGGIGTGIQVLLPANTERRVARVYALRFQSGVTVTATLSDGSAAAATDSTTITSIAGQGDYVIEVLYSAASAGQTLTISYTNNSIPGGNSAVQAAGWFKVTNLTNFNGAAGDITLAAADVNTALGTTPVPKTTSIAGGVAGGLEYQTAVDNTGGSLSIGSTGQLLTSSGTAPSWVTPIIKPTLTLAKANATTTAETVVARWAIPANAITAAMSDLQVAVQHQCAGTGTIIWKLHVGGAGTTADTLVATLTTSAAQAANTQGGAYFTVEFPTTTTAIGSGFAVMQAAVLGTTTAAAVTATIVPTAIVYVSVTVTCSVAAANVTQACCAVWGD